MTWHQELGLLTHRLDSEVLVVSCLNRLDPLGNKDLVDDQLKHQVVDWLLSRDLMVSTLFDLPFSMGSHQQVTYFSPRHNTLELQAN